MSELADQSCVPCRGGVPPLPEDEQARLLAELDDGWVVVAAHHLHRAFVFPDFAGAWTVARAVGEVAEAEGHHPDLALGWGRLTATIYTHKIDGLTESDFFLAAKISRCYAQAGFTAPPLLSAAERARRLGELGAGWAVEDGPALVRTFERRGWTGVEAFAGAVAELAEAAGHHPDLALSWGTLRVSLTTHDAGGLTEKDFDLAAEVTEAWERH